MYQLNLTPRTETGKNELTGTVYWYPLNVGAKSLMSANIAARSTYEQLEERWTRGGRIIISSPIDDDHVYFLYFGTIGDPKILPTFGVRPLLVKDQSLYYFFSDDDFDGIYKEMNAMLNILHADNANIHTKQKMCHYFFNEYLLSDWSLSLKYIESECTDRDIEEWGFHTSKIGLHPLLHLIRLIPDANWEKEYYKKILIYLFKNDFLVDWLKVDDIENPDERRRILQKCEKISDWEITDVRVFENVLKDILKQLINKHEFFGILYLASQSASESSVVRALFNNLFELVPRDQEEWIGYPKFQPKMVIDELEVHFIQRAGPPAKINGMADALKKIWLSDISSCNEMTPN